MVHRSAEFSMRLLGAISSPIMVCGSTSSRFATHLPSDMNRKLFTAAGGKRHNHRAASDEKFKGRKSFTDQHAIAMVC